MLPVVKRCYKQKSQQPKLIRTRICSKLPRHFSNCSKRHPKEHSTFRRQLAATSHRLIEGAPRR